MTGRIWGLLRRFGILTEQRSVGHSSAATAVAEFGVADMVCEGCAENIDGILRAIPGVREVQPNVAKKRIQVRYESGIVDRQQLKDRLTAAGFTPADADLQLSFKVCTGAVWRAF